MNGRARWWITAAAALMLAASVAASPGCQALPEEIEQDALRTIADLEDRRVPHPASWESLLTRAEPEVRQRAALAVGRLREPGLAPLLRRALAVEQSDAVRGELLFAMGQANNPAAADVLLVYLRGNEPKLRAVAAEALGKLALARSVPTLVANLLDPDPVARGAVLLAIARVAGRRAEKREALDLETASAFVQAAGAMLADGDADVRWKAAYTLANVEVKGRLEPLLKAAAGTESGSGPAGDELTRFFGVVGLAQMNDPDERRTEALVAAADQGSPHLAAAAIGGLRRTADASRLPKMVEWLNRNRVASDLHVRSAAAGAIAAVGQRSDAKTGHAALTALRNALADPSRMVRAEAMKGLVLLDERVAIPLFTKAAAGLEGTSDVYERVAALQALEAAPLISVGEPLLRLAGDANAYVASEALRILGLMVAAAPNAGTVDPAWSARLAAAARRGVAARDVAVAGSALSLLKKVGSAADLAAVAAAYDRLSGVDDTEARVEAVHAAAALGGAAAADLLRRAREADSPAVCAAADDEWKKLALPDDPAPPRVVAGRPGSEGDGGSRPSSVRLEPGIDLLSSAPDPRILLHFARGDVTIALHREEAPHHVKMLLDRVASGKCDGLPIHRVVSGFVVQGLDPRGDGWGSGGLFLRDEIGRTPYLRGAVGMPNTGPDSGGCQLFVTVVPTPHLDGRYTLFGQVVGGMDVVDALDLGDVCRKAELLPATAPRATVP